MLMVVLAKFMRYLFEFLYDVCNAYRVVYLNVTLPRGDDKISREQSRDVAKDMKEKLARMGQMYDAMHKLGQSSFMESILKRVFRKPKVTLILHYEKGLLRFIISAYPEYKKIMESAIAAQYPDASIETMTKIPNYFGKRYHSITTMNTKKDPVFPIKTFKQMPDDPLNNIIDTMGKVSNEDTFSIVIPIKPIGDTFNIKAKKWASGLYRREKFYMQGGKKRSVFLKVLLAPWHFISFIIRGGAAKAKEK